MRGILAQVNPASVQPDSARVGFALRSIARLPLEFNEEGRSMNG